MSENQTPNPNEEENTPKLYAGKFKTAEELEAGYKNAAVVFDENEKLKQQVGELSTVPDNYLNPADVELEANRLTDIQQRAKDAGLTQIQYEKMVRSEKARIERNNQTFENARKDVGEQTLNILNDYVSKHYPKELQQNMLNTFIANKDARTAALNHRDQLLNNQVPGMSKTAAGGYNVTDEDIQKAYAKKEKNPGDLRARQHYINLHEQRAAQQGS